MRSNDGERALPKLAEEQRVGPWLRALHQYAGQSTFVVLPF